MDLASHKTASTSTLQSCPRDRGRRTSQSRLHLGDYRAFMPRGGCGRGRGNRSGKSRSTFPFLPLVYSSLRQFHSHSAPPRTTNTFRCSSPSPSVCFNCGKRGLFSKESRALQGAQGNRTVHFAPKRAHSRAQFGRGYHRRSGWSRTWPRSWKLLAVMVWPKPYSESQPRRAKPAERSSSSMPGRTPSHLP